MNIRSILLIIILFMLSLSVKAEIKVKHLIIFNLMKCRMWNVEKA